MMMNISVRDSIKTSIGSQEPECFGVLGIKKGVVCRFWFCGRGEASFCEIKDVPLNRVITEWYAEGVQFAGIIHSHPNRMGDLSASDRRYITSIVNHNQTINTEYTLFFPIVIPEDETAGVEIVSHRMIYSPTEGVRIKPDEVILIDGNAP